MLGFILSLGENKLRERWKNAKYLIIEHRNERVPFDGTLHSRKWYLSRTKPSRFIYICMWKTRTEMNSEMAHHWSATTNKQINKPTEAPFFSCEEFLFLCTNNYAIASLFASVFLFLSLSVLLTGCIFARAKLIRGLRSKSNFDVNDCTMKSYTC